MSVITRLGGLAAIALLGLAGPAEAFGGRGARATWSYVPTYHDCCYLPIYCPPICWPHPHPHPHHDAGWDCVCNRTNQVLRVHVASGYGSWEAVLHPGQCFSFWFIRDNKPRVLSAFTLSNQLVRLVPAFSLLDQTGRPRPLCFNIFPGPVTTAAPSTEAERGQERSEGGSTPPTGGQPF